jgi:acetyltransferase-like isoleucine patch superfamily enzyme
MYLYRIKKKIERIYLGYYFRCKAIMNFSFISFKTKIYAECGANFVIGKNVRVRAGCIITIASGSTLTLKNNSWIGPGCIIYCKNNITIGYSTRVAHYTSIIDHDYSFSGKINFDEYISKPIYIGNLVWIGNSCIILKDSHIGDNSIIGASTLLKSKKIPSNHIYYDKKNSVLYKLNEK